VRQPRAPRPAGRPVARGGGRPSPRRMPRAVRPQARGSGRQSANPDQPLRAPFRLLVFFASSAVIRSSSSCRASPTCLATSVIAALSPTVDALMGESALRLAIARLTAAATSRRMAMRSIMRTPRQCFGQPPEDSRTAGLACPQRPYLGLKLADALLQRPDLGRDPALDELHQGGAGLRVHAAS